MFLDYVVSIEGGSSKKQVLGSHFYFANIKAAMEQGVEEEVRDG